LLLTENWPALERIGLDYPGANCGSGGNGRLPGQRWRPDGLKARDSLVLNTSGRGHIRTRLSQAGSGGGVQ